MDKGFFKCLLANGYKGNQIKPLFHKAITHAQQYTGPPPSKDNDNNQVILHLPFHPNDRASFKIKAAWRTHVSYPRWKIPLENMTNLKT